MLSLTLSLDPPQELDLLPTNRATNGELKLKVVRDLWTSVRTTIPHSLPIASEKTFPTNEDELLDEDGLSDLDV